MYASTYVAHARMRTRVVALVVVVFDEPLHLALDTARSRERRKEASRERENRIEALWMHTSKNAARYYSTAEYLHSTRRLGRQKGEIRRAASGEAEGGREEELEREKRKTSGEKREAAERARRHGDHGATTMRPGVNGRYVDIRLIPIECLYCI